MEKEGGEKKGEKGEDRIRSSMGGRNRMRSDGGKGEGRVGGRIGSEWGMNWTRVEGGLGWGRYGMRDR